MYVYIEMWPNGYLLVILFINLFFAVLGLHCCMDFSLVVTSGELFFIVECGLLIVAASLLVEQGL